MGDDNRSGEIVELLKEIRDNQKLQLETQTNFQKRVKVFQIGALVMFLPLYFYWYSLVF